MKLLEIFPLLAVAAKRKNNTKAVLAPPESPRATPACSGLWFAAQRARVNQIDASGVFQGAGELSEASVSCSAELLADVQELRRRTTPDLSVEPLLERLSSSKEQKVKAARGSHM